MALTVYRHLYGYGNGRIKIAANLCAVHLFSVLLWRRHGGDRRASSGNYVGAAHWPLATATGHVHTVASGDQGRVGRWTPVVATPMSMSPPPRHAVCTRSGLRDDTRSGGDILTTFLFLSRL